MKIPHCRAKVKVRVRTDGENRMVPEMAQGQRTTVCAGGSPFTDGEGIVLFQNLPSLWNIQKDMKTTLVAVCAFFTAAAAVFAQPLLVDNFDEIPFWTGSGPLRAALVLDFGESTAPSSLAWGYRWSGTAEVEDMLFALSGTIPGGPQPLAGSDARLSASVGFFEGLGYYVTRLEYTAAGLGGGWTAGPRVITDEYFVNGTYPSLYSLSGNGSWTGADWVYSENDGMSSLALTDGGWFGFAQSNGTSALAFAQPVGAPVPEPAVWALGVFSIGIWRFLRRCAAGH